jgi:hypothetical protein
MRRIRAEKGYTLFLQFTSAFVLDRLDWLNHSPWRSKQVGTFSPRADHLVQ